MSRKREAEEFEMDKFLIESLRREYDNFEAIVENIRRHLTSISPSSIDYERLIETEKKIRLIQDEILKIINDSKSPPKRPQVYPTAPLVIVRCKNWSDFKSNAKKAKAVSYLLRTEEGVFQADALKNEMIYTYSGQIPQTGTLLKIWLSKELNVEEERILEGVLAIG